MQKMKQNGKMLLSQHKTKRHSIWLTRATDVRGKGTRRLSDSDQKPSHCQDLITESLGVEISACKQLSLHMDYNHCEGRILPTNEFFDPKEKCCVCGGGEQMSQELYDSIPEYEFKCRDSDYRIVVSDPEWDVVDVKADASERGNLMLIAVTAIHNETSDQITSVTLLSGSECYARDDILVRPNFGDILDVKIGETWKIGYKSTNQEYLHFWDYTLHALVQPYSYLQNEVILISYSSSKAKGYDNPEKGPLPITQKIRNVQSESYVPHSLQSNDFVVFFAFSSQIYQVEQFGSQKGQAKFGLVNEGRFLAMQTAETYIFTVLYDDQIENQLQIRLYTKDFDQAITFTINGFEYDDSSESVECQDTANGALDIYNFDCSAYYGNEQYCGILDDSDFRAQEMCCACQQKCLDYPDYNDAYGFDCQLYTDFPSDCGKYDVAGGISSMTACCACQQQPSTSPVARISPFQDESGVVMCSYLPHYQSSFVYFTQTTLQSQKSLKAVDWSECLSVYTNDTTTATFLLKYQSNYIKTLTIDFSNNSAQSKTSLHPLENLVSSETPNRFSKGILNAKDQLFFGITDHVYTKQITGKAGFLSSLTNSRKTKFYSEQGFSADWEITTTNDISLVNIQSVDIIPYPAYIDDSYESYSHNQVILESRTDSRYYSQDENEWPWPFKRYKLYDEICTQGVTSSHILQCIQEPQKNKQSCDPAIFIEDIDYEASDVCKPIWIKGTITGNDFVVEQVHGGQMVSVNYNDLRSMNGTWISMQLDDKWPLEEWFHKYAHKYEYIQTVRFNTAIINEFEIEARKKQSLNILPQLISEEEPNPLLEPLLFSDAVQIIGHNWTSLEQQIDLNRLYDFGDFLRYSFPYVEYEKFQDFFYEVPYQDRSPVRYTDPRIIDNPVIPLVQNLEVCQYELDSDNLDCKAPQSNSIRVSFNRRTLLVDVDTSNIRSNDNSLLYGFSLRMIYSSGKNGRSAQIFTTNNLLVVRNKPQIDESDGPIHIEGSWAQFYFKNYDDPLLKPDPPSIDQIEQSELSEGEKKFLLQKLYPKTQSVSEDSSIKNNDVLNEARSEADFLESIFEGQKSQPVDFDIYFDRSKGLISIKFADTIYFPTYMLKKDNQTDSNQYASQRRMLGRSDVQQIDGLFDYSSLIELGVAALVATDGLNQYFVFTDRLADKIEAINQQYNQELRESIFIEDCEEGSTYNPIRKICEEKNVEEEDDEISRETAFYFQSFSDLVSVKLVKLDGSESTIDWSPDQIQREKLDLQIETLALQQKDIYKLVIDLSGLSQFHGGLPESNVVEIDIQQKKAEVEKSKQLEQAQTAASSALVFSVVVKFSTGYTLNSIWGMLNGLQLAAYLPLINIDVPEKTAEFSGFIAEIVTFDLPNVDMESVLSLDAFQCPESEDLFTDVNMQSYSDKTVISGYEWEKLRILLLDDPYFNRILFMDNLSNTDLVKYKSLASTQDQIGWTKAIEATNIPMFYQIQSLDTFGFSSAYQSRTLGTAFIWYLIMTLGFIIIIGLSPFKNQRYFGKVRSKLVNSLCWNSVLRTIMQTSLELCFCAYFTIKYAQYDGRFCSFINILYAYVFTALIFAFPIFTIVFYRYKIIRFMKYQPQKEEAHDKQLALTQATKLDSTLQMTISNYNFIDLLESKDNQTLLSAIEQNKQSLEIQNCNKTQFETISLLHDEKYIDDAKITQFEDKMSVTVNFNEKLLDHLKKDIEFKRKVKDFLDTYGNPLDGLNRNEIESLWFPALFTIMRVLFCATTLYLWDRPLLLLLVRQIVFILFFTYSVTIHLYEKVFTQRLEIMNQTVTILLVDVMILFTGVINQGNPDDANSGSVKDYEYSIEMTSMFYIIIFSALIGVHLLILLVGTFRDVKLLIQRAYVRVNLHSRRQRLLQEKQGSNTRCTFVSGMCLRLICSQKALQKDKKFGIIEEEERLRKEIELGETGRQEKVKTKVKSLESKSTFIVSEQAKSYSKQDKTRED